MIKKPLYHTLDPFWKKVPFPFQTMFEEDKIGPINSVNMARKYFNKNIMSVRVYFVGDTMIDTGLYHLGRNLIAYAKDKKIKKALVTHYHEDHSGNMKNLCMEGIKVYATELTKKIVNSDPPVKFYQHLIWGKARPSGCSSLQESITIGPYQAKIIPTPGHSPDHVIFYVSEKGWLFSGDIYISETLKYFRADEDFHQIKNSLERILKLDFDTIFCGHRPILKNGKNAIKRKLQWFYDIEGEVKKLHSQGFSLSRITSRVFPKDFTFTKIITCGDVSGANLVHSILHGPKTRPEIRAALKQD